MRARFVSRLFPMVMIAALMLLTAVPSQAAPPVNARINLHIPDIAGYVTLKCDFHMHTVFSDGAVWPTVRIQEAWREGLDVISITDHIEYQPHKADVPTNYNRPYAIALPSAEAAGIMLIRGAEITRPMPPGHLNAIFIKNADSLAKEDWRGAIAAASGQGAFIFYNHPGFPDPKGNPLWGPDHEELLRNGRLHGVEVVNEREYYPESHRWCLEKKLAMIASSDQHSPIEDDYLVRDGEHRPITLVFAKKRTPEAVMEALFARRTAVWSENTLIGEERFLRPIFSGSIEVVTPERVIKGNGSANVQVRNDSDVTFELVRNGDTEYVTAPGSATLYAGRTVILTIRAKPGGASSGRKRVHLPYTVKNLLVAPGQGLAGEIPVTVRIIPAGKK